MERWDWSVVAPLVCINLYGSDNCVIENCAGTNNTSYKVWGQFVWAHRYNPTANHNKIRGSVYYGKMFYGYVIDSEKNTITGNGFHNNASIGARYGVTIRADTNLSFTNHTAADGLYGVYYQKGSYKGGVNVAFKNSNIYKNIQVGLQGNDGSIVFQNTYNNVFNNYIDYYGTVSEGLGEIHIDPAYDTTTYGKGAYLIRPDNLKGLGENGAHMGADIIYRYQDGVLTNVPLWPWPMEDRIFAENGVSVTWETNEGYGRL